MHTHRIALAIAAATLTGFAAATAGTAQSAPNHARLVSTVGTLTGESVLVRCRDLSGDGVNGWMWRTQAGTARIDLAADVCHAAEQPRIITPPWPRANTGQALLAIGHESGHVHGLNEDKAECYGLRNLHRTAKLLGFPRSSWPAITKQARETTYCIPDR